MVRIAFKRGDCYQWAQSPVTKNDLKKLSKLVERVKLKYGAEVQLYTRRFFSSAIGAFIIPAIIVGV